MRLPNKVTPYKKSTLAKLPVVITALREGPVNPLTLYKKVKRQVGSVSDFVAVLSCLYALNTVDFLDEEVLGYVENDSM